LASGQYVPQVGNNAWHCLSDSKQTDRQTGREIMNLGKED